ncbi:MAG: hypothetical protein M9916_09400 [Crocinitomicaceae bacterium]|nr:hypothetical protein [Crocinitomicaceae bacterium]
MMEFVALGIGFIILYFAFVCGIFVAIALFYKTMVDIMTLIRPENRLTTAGNIMLTFIPLYNLVYGFILYPKICDSISKEYTELGLKKDGDFGKSLAITFLILAITVLIPIINIFSLVAMLVIGIIFWVKMDKYKKELEKYNKMGWGDATRKVSTSNDILD